MVDMAADNAVDAMALRLGGQRLLEGSDIVHGVLDLVLCPLRQRPIGKTELTANGVEIAVHEDRKIVGGVAKKRQPARVFDHQIEHVAMHDQIAAAVGTFMDRRLNHLDTAKMGAVIVAQELVVIAGQIDDARALARLAHQLLHHVVVRLRPIPARPQLPAVDDVADQIDRFGIVVAQEVEEAFGLAASRAEMNIRDEESTEQTCAVLRCHDV
jgi:hypothetical protein